MTDSGPANPTSPSRDRGGWVKWLLIASLATNLLVVGVVAGAWFHGHRHGLFRAPGGPSDFGLLYFSRTLPEERRGEVRKLLREGRADLRTRRDEMTKLRQAAAEALAADDFTPERLRQAMDAIGGAEMAKRDAGVDVLMKVVAILTPEDRKRLSEWWKHRLEKEARYRRKRPAKTTAPAAADKPAPQP